METNESPSKPPLFSKTHIPVEQHLLAQKLLERSNLSQMVLDGLMTLFAELNGLSQSGPSADNIREALASLLDRLLAIAGPSSTSRFLNASSTGVFELAGEFHPSAHDAVRRIGHNVARNATMENLATIVKGSKTWVFKMIPIPRRRSATRNLSLKSINQFRNNNFYQVRDFANSVDQISRAFQPKVNWLQKSLKLELDRAMVTFAPLAVLPDRGEGDCYLILGKSRCWIGSSGSVRIEPAQSAFLEALIKANGTRLTAKAYRKIDSDKARVVELVDSLPTSIKKYIDSKTGRDGGYGLLIEGVILSE